MLSVHCIRKMMEAMEHNGTNGNHGFEAIPSKSPWCRCWNPHPCLVIESHVAYIEYVFLRIPNDLSGWWFRCRDVGEGIHVLNPMPWTIRVTSHLRCHLTLMLHRSIKRGYIPRFTVPSLLGVLTISHDYPNFIDPSWWWWIHVNTTNGPLVTYTPWCPKNGPRIMLCLIKSHVFPCFPREIPMVSLESPGKLQRL